jgi:hypothetical protein
LIAFPILIFFIQLCRIQRSPTKSLDIYDQMAHCETKMEIEPKTEAESPRRDSALMKSANNTVEEDDIDSQNHLTGARLLIIVSVITTVAFLVFLDSSIIVTVSFSLPK